MYLIHIVGDPPRVSGVSGTDITLQAMEIAADVCAVEYLQTMIALKIPPGITYKQVIIFPNGVL